MADKMKKGFRGSLNGYKKKDVNGYILELSKKYSDIEKEYRERIEALEAENEELSLKLAAEKARADEAEVKAAEAAEGKTAPEEAKKAAEALSEIKRMRSQLKKRVKEFESKYGDVLPASKKKNDAGDREGAAEPALQPTVSEDSGRSHGNFESYLNEFRSSTSALFSEFDRKYGTKISGGDRK